MKKLERKIRDGVEAGIDTLTEICKSGERDADRLAAAKALLEYAAKRSPEDDADANALRVVLENVPGEYLN